MRRRKHRATNCVICGRELTGAPTKRWWIHVSARKGICYECILKLAKSVLRAMEKYTEEG